MAKKATRPGARKNVSRQPLTRFAHKRGSRGRARFGGWRKILMHKFAPGPVLLTPDPVSLAIFAIDRVGPAAVRASGRLAYASANRAVTALAHLSRDARFRRTRDLI